ncbi:MAG TPA: GNAT family N-acetyltransferase [Cellvibrio sp.]|nr:GNAT family N-acetyltransferase [Cellvibrio sp.]
MTVFESVVSVQLPPYLFQSVAPERYALVDRFYRAQGYKVKCTEQEKLFVLCLPTGELIAAVRLVPQGSGHYWLRNLLVAPEWRNGGLASALLNHLKPAIAPYGCYFFALPHLLGLYQRLDFDRNPSHCPADIAAIYEKYRSRGRDWVLMGYIQR